jgi:hypothetical protein
MTSLTRFYHVGPALDTERPPANGSADHRLRSSVTAPALTPSVPIIAFHELSGFTAGAKSAGIAFSHSISS